VRLLSSQLHADRCRVLHSCIPGALRGARRARQEFGHPQARFLHEKRWRLSPGVQRTLQPLLGAINRATFFAVDSAMFTGTVRAGRVLRALSYPNPALSSSSLQRGRVSAGVLRGLCWKEDQFCAAHAMQPTATRHSAACRNTRCLKNEGWAIKWHL
jgi:hypothetical protein